MILGFLFDEGTTLLLFLRGYGVFETNPFITRFGVLAYICLLIVFYGAFIITWKVVIKSYNGLYKTRSKGYKLYDIFIFLFCFMIIFFVGMKIELGYNNIQLLAKSYDDVKGPILDDWVEQNEVIRIEQPEKYIAVQDKIYKKGTLEGINVLQLFFYVMSSYLFFRVGNKVCPYQYG